MKCMIYFLFYCCWCFLTHLAKYMIKLGDIANSLQQPERKCSPHEKCDQLYNEKECFSYNSFRKVNLQTVRVAFLVWILIKSMTLTIHYYLLILVHYMSVVREYLHMYSSIVIYWLGPITKDEQIQCRIAMHESFPLNDTYFQVNKVK